MNYDNLFIHQHDLFSFYGLGKTGGLLYQALEGGPKTEKQLVELTGKTSPTVKSNLEKMSRIVDIRTGEIIPMVYEKEKTWYLAENLDLDRLAELLGVDGYGEERKNNHRIEREKHRKQLERNGIDDE